MRVISKSAKRSDKFRLKFFGILCLVLWVNVLLAACSAPSATPVPPTATSIPTATTLPPTAAPTVTPVPPTAMAVLPTATPVVTPVSQTNTAKTLKMRWIQGIPCLAPCWEGITPGKTTIEEAIDLLKQNPLVRADSVEIIPPIPYREDRDGQLIWRWKETSLTGGYIEYDHKSTTHTVLLVSPGVNPEILEAKLNDIIQVYGEPSHVNAGTMVAPSITIAWFPQGIVAGINGKPGDKKPVLDSSLIIKIYRFIVPTTREKYLEGGVVPIDLYVPWQGYKDFDFYCNASPSNYCK